jgi:ferric-dicitrate binding protein FerR (iron transport regulator)
VFGKGDSDWQQLMVTDDLRPGDRVRTDFDGRVEVLLNPGSYLRVGGNSEVEMSNNSLENLELRLIKGTAIVEATGVDDLELNINISTPHTKIAIVRHGLYRVSVVPGDTTELVVRKGRVVLNDNQTKVKGGNKVVFSQTNTSVAKLTKEDKKTEEEIDAWSKERAETLARANRRTTHRMLATAFSMNNDPFRSWRWSRGYGLWFFNAHAGCYTFIPWYYGWRSPYGTSYTTGTYNPYAWSGGRGGYSNPGGGSSNPTSTGSGGNGGSSNPGGGSSAAPRPITPSGGYGNPGGGSPSAPRAVRGIDSDTGQRMPNKPRPN